jgi:hypothetical protein
MEAPVTVVKRRDGTLGEISSRTMMMLKRRIEYEFLDKTRIGELKIAISSQPRLSTCHLTYHCNLKT